MLATTATTAGDSLGTNEDLALTSSNCVVLLDGATTRTKTGCQHSVSWYVRHLAASIMDNMRRGPAGALAEAITITADRHRSSCDLSHPATPCAAVAIVQCIGDQLDYLVLGDCTIVMMQSGSTKVITDSRVDNTAAAERNAADRWAIGSSEKASALLAMKQAELAQRNQPGGYWVAAADPAVVSQAIVGRTPIRDIQDIALLTDGAARAVTFGLLKWSDVVRVARDEGPAAVIDRVRAAERTDPLGRRWPRNKASDDATVVLIDLEAPHDQRSVHVPSTG